MESSFWGRQGPVPKRPLSYRRGKTVPVVWSCRAIPSFTHCSGKQTFTSNTWAHHRWFNKIKRMNKYQIFTSHATQWLSSFFRSPTTLLLLSSINMCYCPLFLEFKYSIMMNYHIHTIQYVENCIFNIRIRNSSFVLFFIIRLWIWDI